jgi:hypothetical protein
MLNCRPSIGRYLLGASKQEVDTLLQRPDARHLEMPGRDVSSDEWWIETPLEIGAKNWTVGLQFTNGRLSATRVRMADGDYHPDGAPPDRGIWDGGR